MTHKPMALTRHKWRPSGYEIRTQPTPTQSNPNQGFAKKLEAYLDNRFIELPSDVGSHAGSADESDLLRFTVSTLAAAIREQNLPFPQPGDLIECVIAKGRYVRLQWDGEVTLFSDNEPPCSFCLPNDMTWESIAELDENLGPPCATEQSSAQDHSLTIHTAIDPVLFRRSIQHDPNPGNLQPGVTNSKASKSKTTLVQGNSSVEGQGKNKSNITWKEWAPGRQEANSAPERFERKLKNSWVELTQCSEVSWRKTHGALYRKLNSKLAKETSSVARLFGEFCNKNGDVKQLLANDLIVKFIEDGNLADTVAKCRFKHSICPKNGIAHMYLSYQVLMGKLTVETARDIARTDYKLKKPEAKINAMPRALNAKEVSIAAKIRTPQSSDDFIDSLTEASHQTAFSYGSKLGFRNSLQEFNQYLGKNQQSLVALFAKANREDQPTLNHDQWFMKWVKDEPKLKCKVSPSGVNNMYAIYRRLMTTPKAGSIESLIWLN